MTFCCVALDLRGLKDREALGNRGRDAVRSREGREPQPRPRVAPGVSEAGHERLLGRLGGVGVGKGDLEAQRRPHGGPLDAKQRPGDCGLQVPAALGAHCRDVDGLRRRAARAVDERLGRAIRERVAGLQEVAGAEGELELPLAEGIAVRLEVGRGVDEHLDMVALPDSVTALGLAELVVRHLRRHVQVAIAPGKPRATGEVIRTGPGARRMDDLLGAVENERVGDVGQVRQVPIERKGGVRLQRDAEGVLGEGGRGQDNGEERREHHTCGFLPEARRTWWPASRSSLTVIPGRHPREHD